MSSDNQGTFFRNDFSLEGGAPSLTAGSIDINQVRTLLKEKAELTAVLEQPISVALSTAIRSTARGPFVAMFRVVFLSIMNNINLGRPFPDLSIASAQLQLPDNSTHSLASIRSLEIWPGGWPTGVNFIGQDGVYTFTRKGDHVLKIDTEYAFTNLILGQLAFGCILGVFVNGTPIASQAWVPEGVTQNGIPVHESFPFSIP